MLVTTSCFSPLHIFIARMNSNDYKVPPVLSDEEYYDLLDEIGGYMPFGLRAYHFVCTNQLLQNPIMAGYPNCASLSGNYLERDLNSRCGCVLKAKAKVSLLLENGEFTCCAQVI